MLYDWGYGVKDSTVENVLTKKILIRRYLAETDSLSGEAFDAGLQAKFDIKSF